MNQTRHPNFILGLVSLLLLIFGVASRANGYRPGDYILIAALVLGGIHWIWAIIDVFKGDWKESGNRVLWIILVIAIPPVGGLLYYAMKRKGER